MTSLFSNNLLNLLDWLVPKLLCLGQHVEPQVLHHHPQLDPDRAQAFLDITGLPWTPQYRWTS